MAGTFKTIADGNIQTTQNVLNQLVDFVVTDMSGSETRKKYQVFVTGSGGNGVTSSLFQTVFDQNFTLQTSNELFDLTVGVFDGSDLVLTASGGTTVKDSAGKRLFPSQSIMMREKIQNYSQFAQILLGDSAGQFSAPFTDVNSSPTNLIDVAMFMPFKRLFTRDGIKRETFAMRFFQSASAATRDDDGALSATAGQTNLFRATTSGSTIYTDVGSAASIETSAQGGSVGNIVNSANTNESVGLLFYDYGVAVFDLEKITSGSQLMSGSIEVANAIDTELVSHRFIPGFIMSASIDQIIDHLATVRFGSTAEETFLTFQNNTFINSTLYFCRATADEFNFSTNPTFTDANGKIVVINESTGLQKSFVFVTTVGLYNANEDLLAVAKLSRPVMKNDEKDLTFRVRLDF